ncbi:MAG: polysaccharide biosynthesis protein [Nitrospirota bacterium]
MANYLAFLIRFESELSSEYLTMFASYLPVLLLIRLIFIIQPGLHKGMWRYASINDLIKIINSATFGSVIFFISVRYVVGDMNYPRSIFVLDWILFIILSSGSRLFIRVFREYVFLEPLSKKILIVGAGDASEMIAREMKNNRDCPYKPIGFADDDIHKKGLTIHGIPILGQIGEIPKMIKKLKPDEILIATSDTQVPIRDIFEMCKEFNIPIKKLPGVNDLLGGNVSIPGKIGQHLIDSNLVTEAQVEEALALQQKEGGRLGAKLVKLGYITEEKLVSFLNKHYSISHIRPISLEDLLQREPVDTKITAIMNFIEGKSVLVTGAGGSIGSELCRQVIKYNPSSLLLLDRYENSVFEVDLDLRSRESKSSIETIIGDIQDTKFLNHIFSKYRPQIIFHAAAYKHVPLMEYNPVEAVKNNIFGTKNLVDAAVMHEAENFVMISTDKAVNPTNVMGATKRIAEYLVFNMNSAYKTKFTTVRFGNVLGTSGSVVPIFQEQLKKGGPLTVTHPEVKRFFMLIEEAVHLVLVAAASGKGGEIFVLDMGSPIKIVDLAENFVRLSGFIPHKEIKILFTGLRPGEKLREELFDESEIVKPTSHRKLMMAVPVAPPKEFLSDHISELEYAIRNYSVEDVILTVQKIVPNFRSKRHDRTVFPEGAHEEFPV